ncbi:hypothetical protein C7271_05720 [filamentous cyanobacterium CCP5]|nr:hypothetical protein C7271_05720 [filamentous cyanobacterium CCP5]
MRLFLVSALVISFLAILFASQNNTPVEIRFFNQEFSYSLALVLLVTLGIGAIIGLLFSLPAIVRRGWRSSRLQRQTGDLNTQIEQQSQVLNRERHRLETTRENYRDLLDALNLVDPVTGLLRPDALNQATASLLKRMASRIGDDRYRSVGVLTLQSVLAQPSATAHTPQELREIWQTAGQQLRSHASADTWLYSDGAGKFLCTITGFDIKAATDYGEALQRAMTQTPLALSDGRQVPLEVSLGGAIATQDQPVEAKTLIDAAQNALKQAQQRGSHRPYLVQAAPAT